MSKHTITLSALDLTISYSLKDNSPKGYHTVPGTELKPGDKIVINNYFHEIIEEPIPAEPETEITPIEPFPLLSEEVRKEYATRRNDYRFYIENGYFPTWAAEHRNNPDQGIKAYSTPAKWELYQAGSITREKAVKIATKRALKEIDKREAEAHEKLRTVANTAAVEWCTISVEWVKNRYWGNNPHTTITTNNGTTYGKAGGCGYDKESAAIAHALNENPAILRVLYDAAEKALRENNPPERYSNGNYTWRYNIGYGSGYSILPYFEGGVGSCCFWSIFEKCGYKCKHTAGGKMYDHYTITKEV